MKPLKIHSTYGELPFSQLNCLTCRSAMYLYSMILCRILKIDVMAEGARSSQKFAIEQKEILDCYRLLLKNSNIDLVLPVIDLVSDFELENELMIKGFVLKTLEPQCLLGAPIDPNRPVDEEVILAFQMFFNREIMPKASEIVRENEKAVEYTLKKQGRFY